MWWAFLSKESSALYVSRPQDCSLRSLSWWIVFVYMHWQSEWVPSLRPILMASTCSVPLFSFHHAALRAPPHPPQPLHLFQLAEVQGGAQRSTTQAQSCRCTYGVAHSWRAGVTLCLLGGTLSQVRFWGCHNCPTVWGSCHEYLWDAETIWAHGDRQSVAIRASEIQKQAYNRTRLSHPPSPTYLLHPLPTVTPSHAYCLALLHQYVCCTYTRVCLCYSSPWTSGECASLSFIWVFQYCRAHCNLIRAAGRYHSTFTHYVIGELVNLVLSCLILG